MGRIVLITGASGFIGTNIVRACIQRGDVVHVILRGKLEHYWRLKDLCEKITTHIADITDANAVKSIVHSVQPQQIFHLCHYGGNRGQDDQSLVRKVIIDGSVALFDACIGVTSVESIINAGSSSEYGTKKIAMHEDMKLEPSSDYGLAKAWVSLYGQHLAREKSIPITTLRLFSVYGPYEAPPRLIPNVILAFLRSTDLQLSNSDTTRDFVYIDDVVRAMLFFAEKKQHGDIFNIGTGRETTLKEMVQLLQKECGSLGHLVWGGMRGRTNDGIKWQADVNYTADVGGWSPNFSLEEGARLSVDWFRKNLNLYESF